LPGQLKFKTPFFRNISIANIEAGFLDFNRPPVLQATLHELIGLANNRVAFTDGFNHP
jgi:hypothetical protein